MMDQPLTRSTVKNTLGYHHQSRENGRPSKPNKLKMAAAGEYGIVPTYATGPSALVCRYSVTTPTNAAVRATAKQPIANAMAIAANSLLKPQQVPVGRAHPTCQ